MSVFIVYLDRVKNIDVQIAGWMGCKVVDPESSVPLCHCLHYPHSRELSDELKPYSEDIVFAMEVAEKMRADGFNFKAWQPASEPYNAGDPPLEHAIVSFVCSMGPCEKHGNPHCNHHGAYDVQADTLPLAICKAALLALRGAV